MENLGIRTVLILVAVFLVMNLGWFIGLTSMSNQPTMRCTYSGSSVTCASLERVERHAIASGK
jgi:hypothetical protein